MQKNILPILVISVITLLSSVSCKQYLANTGYNPDKDTLAPKVKITVPILNSTYSYGDDIHLIGSVSDAKIKTLHLEITSGTNIIYSKSPYVDGKDGYTFNEVFNYNIGGPPTPCKLQVTVTDYATNTHTVIDSTLFTIQ